MFLPKISKILHTSPLSDTKVLLCCNLTAQLAKIQKRSDRWGPEDRKTATSEPPDPPLWREDGTAIEHQKVSNLLRLCHVFFFFFYNPTVMGLVGFSVVAAICTCSSFILGGAEPQWKWQGIFAKFSALLHPRATQEVKKKKWKKNKQRR